MSTKRFSLEVAKAESWYGVSHSVPKRGTKAHAAMMRKYRASHKIRSNPVRGERSDGMEGWDGKPVAFVCPGCGGKQVKGKTQHRKTHTGRVCPLSQPTRARKNPWNAERKVWITRDGSVRHPQNCPIPLAASMLAQRREEGKRGPGSKKTARFANCDYRSAEIAMKMKPGVAGSKFSGRVRKGHHVSRTQKVWQTTSKKNGHVVDLTFYAKAKKLGEGTGMLKGIGKLLDWWPSR